MVVKIHPAGGVLEEGKHVSGASFPYDNRRAEPRPNVNRGEDPNRMFFIVEDRPNLVRLKLYDDEPSYFSIVEPTTEPGCLFEATSDVFQAVWSNATYMSMK